MKKPRANSFIGGSSIYLASNIINGIIPFILLPILTRHLSPSEYGEIAMFQTLLGGLSALGGGVIGAAATRKYYDLDNNLSEFAEFIGACLQLILVFSSVLLFIIFIFQDELSELLALKPRYIVLGLFTSLNISIIGLRLGQWQVQKEAFKYGVMQILNSLANLLLSLLFVIVLLKGADGRIDAQIIVSFIFMAFSLYSLNKDKLLSFFNWRKDYIREAIYFGIPLIPHAAGGFLLTTIDRVVINKEIGLAAAGIYMVAVQLTTAISLVFTAMNTAYVPWLFEKLKANNIQEKIKIVQYTYAWFLLIILGAFLSFIIGPNIVTWIAGKQYAEAGQIIGWLCLGQGFQGMYLMVTNYLFYSKKTGRLSIVSLSSGVLNVILLIFLSRILGLKGAAIAFSISMFIRFLLTWWAAAKSHSMPWFKWNPK